MLNKRRDDDFWFFRSHPLLKNSFKFENSLARIHVKNRAKPQRKHKSVVGLWSIEEDFFQDKCHLH